MMFVELSKIEQRLARHLAAVRAKVNAERNATDRKQGPQTGEQIELDGIGAEIAFCKLFNVYPDLQSEIYQKADAVTPQMGFVDVKSTRYKSGKLVCIRTKRGNEADAYALMIGEFPSYRFAGWATAAELLSDDNLTDVGNGPFYAMPQEKLRSA